MVDIKKLFSNVESLYGEYMDRFEKIIRMETYSTDKQAIDNLVEYFFALSKEKGYKAELHHFDIAGNGLLVTMNPDAKKPAVAFCGHMDTVHPRGTFGDDPYKVKDGIIYGPGVYDMKGGLIIGLLAMEALAKTGFTDRPVKFIFVPDEERSEGLSGPEGKQFIMDSAKGCAAAITLEGNTSPSTITVARKGSIRYRVKIRGVAAHAGANYAEGRSAIKDAAHKILEIESESVPDQITYNCGMINGGTSPNTVPEFCEFMLYNRYWTCEQYKELRNHVESILNKPYIPDTKTEFEVIGERYPMDGSEKNYKLAAEISRVSEKYGFGKMEPQKKHAGSDASYTAMAGAPSVCSMGPIGNNAHTLDEYCIASSISDRAKLLSAVIAELPDDF